MSSPSIAAPIHPNHKDLSRHDDLILEPSRRNHQQYRPDREERQRIGPQVRPACPAQNNSPRNIDEISCRYEVTQRIEKLRHGLPREDISRKKDTRKNRKKSQLHSLRLGPRLTRNENTERQRYKQIGKRQNGQQQDAAVDRHPENKPHERQDHAQLKKSDSQIGKQLSKQQSHRPHRRHEK